MIGGKTRCTLKHSHIYLRERKYDSGCENSSHGTVVRVSVKSPKSDICKRVQFFHGKIHTILVMMDADKVALFAQCGQHPFQQRANCNL